MPAPRLTPPSSAGRRRMPSPTTPLAVTRSPLGALGEHAAAVRASRANGFALVGSASRDPGHSLLTRERRPALDSGSGGLVWPSAGGGGASPPPPPPTPPPSACF